jgi:hypothetical protein
MRRLSHSASMSRKPQLLEVLAGGQPAGAVGPARAQVDLEVLAGEAPQRFADLRLGAVVLLLPQLNFSLALPPDEAHLPVVRRGVVLANEGPEFILHQIHNVSGIGRRRCSPGERRNGESRSSLKDHRGSWRTLRPSDFAGPFIGY